MNLATETLTDERRARRMDRAKREKDEGTTAICPEAAVDDNKGRKREPHNCNQHQKGQPHHDLERSISGRLTEERGRERVEESEERTKGCRRDGWREQPSACRGGGKW